MTEDSILFALGNAIGIALAFALIFCWKTVKYYIGKGKKK